MSRAGYARTQYHVKHSPATDSRHGMAERAFLFVKNRSLTRCTDGEFPAGYYDSNGVHPAFVLQKIGNYGVKCCPCTSGPKPEKSYVPEGTKTAPYGKKVPRTSYILHDIPFNPDDEFYDDASPVGIVPEGEIVGDYYNGGENR